MKITWGHCSQELLTGYGDDVTYWDDDGDVYGAFLVRNARESGLPRSTFSLLDC
jgi:hypothetical protein